MGEEGQGRPLSGAGAVIPIVMAQASVGPPGMNVNVMERGNHNTRGHLLGFLGREAV